MTSTNFTQSPQQPHLAPLFFQKICLMAALLLCAGPLFSQVTPADDVVRAYPPKVSSGKFLGNIAPLRDLKVTEATDQPAGEKRLWEKANYFTSNAHNNPDALPKGGDPLVRPTTVRNGDPAIEPLLNIEGIGETGSFPPDPTGDVGKNHYVQMVNGGGGTSQLRVWNKQGVAVTPSIPTSSIWKQVATSSSGDPIIQYDPGAQRWVMLELRSTSINALLVAVSDDSDPTGSWKAYEIPTLGFPDYPKLYVWNNSYIITVNEILGGNVCSGYALEREALLAGDANFQVYRFEIPNYGGINFQPATGADWEGGPPPTPGSPALIFRVYDDAWEGGSDQLQWWEMYADWTDPSQSRIEGPFEIMTAPFETRVCLGGSLFDCIEQPGSLAGRITALENIIMYRAPWRDFGTHQSIVLNHVADVSGNGTDGGDAQVRWYELRRTAGSSLWEIHQQSTFAPDLPTNRFTGTLSIDELGNIGLGYTVCSKQVFPGIRLTGQRVGDPLGVMNPAEYTLAEGKESHSTQRWGDYSSMAVDPEDGRTFWYTGEYQPANKGWGTRIGVFRVRRDSYDLAPQRLVTPVAAVDLANEEVTVELLNMGISSAEGPASVSLFFDGKFVVTDALSTPLAASETLSHTFSQTVDMGELGKTYPFMVVTNWGQDQWVKNDTLRTTVRKLLSYDAAAVGRAGFPSVLCDTAAVVGLVIANVSGLPMQTARLRWNMNSQPTQTVNWTGNLAPGQRDTIWLSLTGIANGSNTFQSEVDQPNGETDQDAGNNTLAFNFMGNIVGTLLTLQHQPTKGALAWELRDASNVLIDSGSLPDVEANLPLCVDDGTCYRVVLRSTTSNWTGVFRVLDFFGKELLEVNQLTPTSVTFNFCTPQRKPEDVGTWTLLSPLSGSALTGNEQVTVEVRNFGTTTRTDDIKVAYRMDGGAWTEETMTVDIPAGKTLPFTFAQKADLSAFDKAYKFEFRATFTGDQDLSNDLRTADVRHKPTLDAALKSVQMENTCAGLDQVTAAVQVQNNGLQVVRKIHFTYSVNGTPQPAISVETALQPEDIATLSLPISGSNNGANALSIQIDSVNGLPSDGLPGNNTGTLSYSTSPNSIIFLFRVIADEKPEELTWELLNEQGNQVLRSGGPYTTPFGTYDERFCLRSDSCYVLKIKDSASDGNKSSFQLYKNAALIWSRDNLPVGAEHPLAFCNTQQPCAAFAALLKINPDKGNTPASDGSIIITPTGGTPNYSYSLDNGAYKFVGIFTSVTAGSHVVRVRDGNGCMLEYRAEVKKTSSAAEPTDAVESRQLSASPNPTSGMVMVTLPALPGERDMTCQLISPQGQVLQTFRLTRWDNTLSSPVALDTYPSGIYLLRATNGRGTWSAQVVKK